MASLARPRRVSGRLLRPSFDGQQVHLGRNLAEPRVTPDLRDVITDEHLGDLREAESELGLHFENVGLQIEPQPAPVRRQTWSYKVRLTPRQPGLPHLRPRPPDFFPQPVSNIAVARPRLRACLRITHPIRFGITRQGHAGNHGSGRFQRPPQMCFHLVSQCYLFK
jgi:hypothetical protein